MSQRVENYLADRIVMLRNDHISRYDNQMRLYRHTRSGPLPTQVTVGGLVRSYRFRYTPDEFISRGTMAVQFDSATHNFSATMVILGGSENDAMIAERIVAETHKISDCSDAVVEAYFSAYCDTIDRYIVVYEPFETAFNPPAESFLTEDSLNLSVFWRDQLRTLLCALSVARERRVVHGSLSDQSSYVMSADRVKFINVGRSYGRPNMKPFHDLYDLSSYISNEPNFGAQNCGNWASLAYLLSSKKIGARGIEEHIWDNDVLQHPLLLEPGDRIVSYSELDVFMWNELDSIGRVRFANAMFVKMPEHYGKEIGHFFDMNRPVYNWILARQNTHDIIYLAIIQFVRNMIKHANDYHLLVNQPHWDESRFCRAIEENLSDGFMGMAYSLSRTQGEDWDDLFR